MKIFVALFVCVCSALVAADPARPDQPTFGGISSLFGGGGGLESSGSSGSSLFPSFLRNSNGEEGNGGGISNFISRLAERIRDLLAVPFREIRELLNRILKRLDNNRITDNTGGPISNAASQTGQAVNDDANQGGQVSRIPAPPAPSAPPAPPATPARLAIEAGNQ